MQRNKANSGARVWAAWVPSRGLLPDVASTPELLGLHHWVLWETPRNIPHAGELCVEPPQLGFPAPRPRSPDCQLFVLGRSHCVPYCRLLAVATRPSSLNLLHTTAAAYPVWAQCHQVRERARMRQAWLGLAVTDSHEETDNPAQA